MRVVLSAKKKFLNNMNGGELKEKAVVKDVSPLLMRQLDVYFSFQKARFDARATQESSQRLRLFEWARQYSLKFLETRNSRADDVESAMVTEARSLALKFIGENNHHFVVDCIDGRNLPSIMFSHVPHIGGVMRTQAGELFGLIDSTDGQNTIVDYSSFEVRSIEKLLDGQFGQSFHYSLDSHFGCAARRAIEQVNGVTQDGGLEKDVRRKIALARGILKIRENLVNSTGNQAGEIFPQFFSYDPHDGTITLGLETQVGLVGNYGFTPEVIANLSSSGKIVRTWDFLNDPEIKGQLTGTVTEADFRSRFSQTMLSNWQAITALYRNGDGLAYRRIFAKIESAYRSSGWQVGLEDSIDGKEISQKVLANKAKLMLKNLVTRFSMARDSQNWPFSEHQEQGIVITESGYAPFAQDMDVFSVFSKEDGSSMADHVHLAASLVRTSRQLGLESEGKKGCLNPVEFLNQKEFVDAPVVIMNKSILRSVNKSEWNMFERIDLSKAFGRLNWDDISMINRIDRVQINNFIVSEMRGIKTEMPVGQALLSIDQFVDGVYDLFVRMRYFMSDRKLRSPMIQGGVIVVNLVADRNRRPKVIIPIVV